MSSRARAATRVARFMWLIPLAACANVDAVTEVDGASSSQRAGTPAAAVAPLSNARSALTVASASPASAGASTAQAASSGGPLPANPWLALLPPGAKRDYGYWAAQGRAQWATRRTASVQRASASLVTTTESEPNDTQASADAVANFGSAADPSAALNGSLAAGDVDYYSFTLRAGDVIAAAVPGGRTLELRQPDGTLLIRTASDPSFLYPAASPLPGNRASTGSSAFAYVVNSAGTYALAVTGPTGTYQLELQVHRPRLEQGGVQTVFVDFDGALVDPAIFGGPAGVKALTPLRDFLPAFGLAATQENALIDAVLAEVRESLSADLASRGLNPKFALDLRNSRDHLDPASDAQASRVVVGGSIAQLGLETIGIAQSIDPGNFAGNETAVVLLDYLSGPNGLASIALAPGSDRLALTARAIGNIVAHEAGHYLGDFHTSNENAQNNIMDEGGNLANTLGLGADGVFGTADDADVDFGVDNYSGFEGFEGVEDTLNTVALATSAQTGLGRLTVRPEALCTGRLRIELRDGNLAGASSVSITSSTGDSETLVLTPSSGVYSGGIDAVLGAAAAANGKLEVQNLAQISVSYLDANDGGGTPRTVTAQASVDCQPATLSNIQARDAGDIAASVIFTSSEPTSASVSFGTSCAGATQRVTADLATNHRLQLTGLTQNTLYYYTITATDAVGNMARADNGGACYTVRTATRTQLFKRTFESGLDGFTVAGGSTTHGFRVTGSCAATLAGHSLPNALWFGSSSGCSYFSEQVRRATATSPAIAVNGGTVTKLRFNYLLDAGALDYVTVFLAVNGKPFQTVATTNTNLTAPSLPATGRSFRTHTIDLNPYLGNSATASVVVRFEFFNDDFADSGLAGFYVDDVEVLSLSAGSECTTAAQCDDGVFCNGVEACVTGRCVNGPGCNDGIDCSLDRCNEAEKRCSNAPLASFCLDEAFCDGANVCSPTAGCVALGNPCSGESELTCDENRKYCAPACDSAFFVDGFESDSLQFEVTGSASLATAAGDHPGATGARGFDIQNTASITSNQIFANRPASLRLGYWLEVNAYDAGELLRVQYCASECDTPARWITLNSVGGTRGWRAYEHVLPASANTDTLQLRFASNANGNNEYAHVDDVVVRNASCSEPLPPFNPSPPSLGAVDVRVDSTNGLSVLSGTASDPDDDLAYVEVLLGGPDLLPFALQRAAGVHSWSAQWYLQPGSYSGVARVYDRSSLMTQGAPFAFMVPERTPPAPGPVFSANFEQGNLGQFTSQGAVSVITAAGDRPGTSGTRGAQIDDSGRLVSLPINASGATGALQLSYWMDLNAFDAGETAKVAYCVANCTVEASWVQLTSVGGTSGWRAYKHALPASAKTSALQVRWLSNANGLLEHVHIDDIVLGTN